MDRRTWKARAAYWAFALGLFACMMLFFAKVHPLTMHDGDDWAYTCYSRGALPIWSYWNPTRIFAETMMPMSAYIAAHAVLPFAGDFITSLTIVFAMEVSLCITAYTLLLGRLMRRICDLPQWQELLLCALFTLMHFLALRSQRTDNEHLFYAWSCNTYFFYMMPALMNACLVMMFERRQRFIANPAGQAFAVLLVYMALCSNILSSYILAVYCGVMLLWRAGEGIKSGKRPGALLRENAWIIAILLVWLMTLVFEINGGRSQILDAGEPFFDRLKQAARAALDKIRLVNAKFLALCILSVLAGIAVLVSSRLRDARDRAYLSLLVRFAVCSALSLTYVILVCAKAAAGYAGRTDVLFGAAFYALAAVLVSAAYVIRRFPRVAAALPLLLVVLYFETDTRWGTFKEHNVSNLPARECADIDRAIIDQIVEADRTGQNEVYVKVPQGPYFSFLADGAARTLFKCGLIERAIPNAYTVEDETFYDRYEIWGHGEPQTQSEQHTEEQP